MMESLTAQKKYEVIIADCPWGYYGDQQKMGAVGKEYKTMSAESLLEIRFPLEKRGILFLWVTDSTFPLAFDMLKANGLFFRGVSFVWIKTKSDGVTPIRAMGVRPSITKPTVEFVIAGSPSRKGRPLPLSDESIDQKVFSPHVRTIGLPHSAKPEEVQNRIERMYPNATKAEFFARRQRIGWDCFGDESHKLAPYSSESQTHKGGSHGLDLSK